MTTDKMTPTHPLIQSLGSGRSPLHPRQAPVSGRVSTHTGRTTQTDPLIFLTSYPEETGTTGDSTLRVLQDR